ncbi:hypothetical protein CSCA_1777 [Clostridium scatologenes]|uniref:Uncharacterized protein n=1 Tax=Clostridium scatologenes TaxID=1548 RepID=A0A0E3K0C7_CLOSL|nr:hypothetical protein CSCA_1777 [Clostridium scatologenes]
MGLYLDLYVLTLLAMREYIDMDNIKKIIENLKFILYN